MCALNVRPAVATERLILRGPEAGDAPAIAELANDPRVAAMLGEMPYPYAPSHADAMIENASRLDPADGAKFVIEHREFGVIGALGLREKAPGRPELGYWIGRAFWGRGYATEAVSAALGWAKGEWRRNVVWAGHFSDNPASGSVLCKAGFLYTGDVELRPSVGRGGDAAPTRMMVWLA